MHKVLLTAPGKRSSNNSKTKTINQMKLIFSGCPYLNGVLTPILATTYLCKDTINESAPPSNLWTAPSRAAALNMVITELSRYRLSQLPTNISWEINQTQYQCPVLPVPLVVVLNLEVRNFD
jgi:hypothetical protein